MNELVVQTLDEALVMVERAYGVLGQALDFQQTRDVQTVAVAAAAYAREAKDNRLLARATELRTRAQCKAGEMLREAEADGTRAGKGRPDKQMSCATTFTATLTDIGITRDQSSKWQQLAALPESEFEEALDLTKAITAEVSADKVLRAVKKDKKKKDKKKRLTIEATESNSDDGVMVEKPKLLTDDQQATVLYNAVRDLAALTCTVAQLRAALPYYQHFRITEGIGRARALLTKVEETWTSND